MLTQQLFYPPYQHGEKNRMRKLIDWDKECEITCHGQNRLDKGKINCIYCWKRFRYWQTTTKILKQNFILPTHPSFSRFSWFPPEDGISDSFPALSSIAGWSMKGCGQYIAVHLLSPHTFLLIQCGVPPMEHDTSGWDCFCVDFSQTANPPGNVDMLRQGVLNGLQCGYLLHSGPLHGHSMGSTCSGTSSTSSSFSDICVHTTVSHCLLFPPLHGWCFSDFSNIFAEVPPACLTGSAMSCGRSLEEWARTSWNCVWRKAALASFLKGHLWSQLLPIPCHGHPNRKAPLPVCLVVGFFFSLTTRQNLGDVFIWVPNLFVFDTRAVLI